MPVANFKYANPQSKPPFRSQEYTYHIRSDESTDHNDQDNEITLQLNTGSGTNHIEHIALCSAEIPLSQYVIEDEQNQIYFSEGIRFDEGDDHRRFIVQLSGGGVEFEIELPLYLNKITRVDIAGDATTVTFTTEFEHGLDLASCWDWGDPIRVIGTYLGDIKDLELTPENVSFMVLSPTTFQIAPLFGTIAWAAPGGFLEDDIGYVWAPGVPDGRILARILNKAFQQAGLTNFHIEYLVSTGRFVVRANRGKQATIQAPTQTHLGNKLGFFHGCATNGADTRSLKLIHPMASSMAPTTLNAELTGGEPDVREFMACVEPGMYTSGAFTNEFNFRFQRFFWDPACFETMEGQTNCPPVDPPVFSFSDHFGVCHFVTIPYGKYTPQQLAAFLEEEMNTFFPATEPYRVEWDPEQQKFIFSNIQGDQFGLEFGCPDPGDQSGEGLFGIANRLGFMSVPHRGLALYCSDFCCPFCDLRDARTVDRSSYIYTMQPLPSQKQLSINVSKMKPFAAELTLNGAGTEAEVVSVPAFAHGLHPDDVVNILVNGQRFLLRVIEVVDAFTFVVETDTAFAVFVPGANEPVNVSLAGLIIPNFLFHDRTQHSADNRCGIRASILGFPHEVSLFDEEACSTTIIAPFQCDFTPPSYILMEMAKPSLSGRISHTFAGETRGFILAKIILFPEIRMERLFPMNQDALSCTQGNRVTLRLVNEDHSPYRLHGKVWSATLCLRVSEPSAIMACS